MRHFTRVLAATAALSVLSACGVDDDTTAAETSDQPGFDDDFARASRTTGVPANVLAAVAYVETQFQDVAGEEEHEGRPAGIGLFALWGENLVGDDASIDAAAARLAQLAAELGVVGDDVSAWEPVLRAFSQNPDDESRAAYAADVMRVLRDGVRVVGEGGEVIGTVAPHAEIVVDETGVPRATTDYASAIWRASPNFNSRWEAGHLVSSTSARKTCRLLGLAAEYRRGCERPMS